MTCCFFGHRDTPSFIQAELKELLKELIEKEGVDRFLVGNEGGFDQTVAKMLCNLKKEYPQIRCYTVLAYINRSNNNESLLETIYPEGLEFTPPRFCIDRRNRWMLKESGAVVGYVCHSIGGAARFFSLAQKQGKKCFNLGK